MIRNIGIRSLIFRIFIFFILIPFLLASIFTFSLFHNFVKRSYGDIIRDSVKTTVKQIENTMSHYRLASMNLYYGNMIENIESGNIDEDLIMGCMQGIGESNRGVLGMILNAGDQYFYYGSLQKEEMKEFLEEHREEAELAEGKVNWYLVNDFFPKYRRSGRMAMLRSLNGSSQKKIGMFCMVIGEQMLSSALQTYDQLSGIKKYLVDGDGMVFYCTDRYSAGERFPAADLLEGYSGSCMTKIDKANSFMVYQKMNLNSWHLVYTISEADMMRGFAQVKYVLWVVALIYILILLILLAIIQKLVCKPLMDMSVKMAEYSGGMEPELEECQNIKEIRLLSRNFVSMTERINQLIRKNQEEMKAKTEYQILVLKTQLSPHFLYNALNTIRWMAAISKQEKIQNTLDALIKILMNAARSESANYLVRDEINLIHNYAVFQKLQYFNFDLNIHADEDVLECRIPRMLIQPLVENSIVHGLGRGEQLEGKIEVRIFREEDLVIEVEDNGCGFDVDKWRKDLEDNREISGTHIGLRNIEHIIRLEYGERYGIEISSSEGKGTCIRCRLPFQMEKPGEQK